MAQERENKEPIVPTFTGRFVWQNGPITEGFKNQVLQPEQWQVGYLFSEDHGYFYLMGNGDVWHAGLEKKEELQKSPVTLVCQRVGTEGKQGIRHINNVPYAYIEYQQIEDSKKETMNPKLKNLNKLSLEKFRQDSLPKIELLASREILYEHAYGDKLFGSLRTAINTQWDLVANNVPELQSNVLHLKTRLQVGLLKLRQYSSVFQKTLTFMYSDFTKNDSKEILAAITIGEMTLEDTHAGIPLNFAKKGKDKMILLPYGLERTVDFVKMWTNAMDQEYDFFKLRFFKAEGDQTLDKLRKGGIGFGLALSEMVAMLSADYVIPPFDMAMQILEGYNEPLAKFPLTEKAIRRTIAMVHYGIERSDNYPDGVPPRDVYFKGTFSGDLFWKIYNFAISDVQNPTP